MDGAVTVVSHLALILAVALLSTIAALYLTTQPLKIPFAAAAGIVLGMRVMASAATGRAALSGLTLTVASLVLAQLLFWSVRLSSQIGAPIAEALRRLTPDFLWVLSSVGMDSADWTKVTIALLAAALLCSLPWRAPPA